MLKILKSAAVNSLIYGFGNLSTKIVGLILIPIYTQHLSVADYGILGLLEVTSYAVFVLFGYQLFYALFRWYWDAEYKDKQKSMFFTVMVFLTVSSLLVCIVLCFYADYLSMMLFGKSDYQFLIQLMIVSSVFQIVAYNPGILMRLQEKSFIYIITNTLQLVTSLSLTVVFIVYMELGVAGIYEAQIIGWIVYLLLSSRFIIKNIETKFDRSLLFEMLKFSAPTILAGVSSIVLGLADRYYLNFSKGLDTTGLYTFGYRIANTVNVLIAASINLAITPIVYKMINDKNNKRFYSKVMTYTIYIVSFFSIAFSVFGKEIVKVLARNPDYWLSYTIIPMICIGIVFRTMRDNVMNGLNIVKKTKVITFVLVVSSIVNILVIYLLVPRYGYYGAANAFLVTHLLTYFMMLYFAQKHYPIEFEYKKTALIIVVSTILIIVALLCNDFHIVLRLTVKTLLVASFPFILYLFNFYEPVEIDRIEGLWNKWKNPFHWMNNIKTLNS